MYNKFFGLAEAPFNITPDSRFLFLSQRHREALSALLYGIRERKGFIMLTGEIGSGKTTVCRALVHELQQDNVKLALVLNPGLSELELLKTINDEFQIPSFYETKKGLVDALNRFLIAENQRGNNVVLIIDEAQNLQPALLEQIRMLSNLETENDKLIQIVLIGQPELNETLGLHELEQLNQRISVRFHITPLNESEVLSYIRHRLFVARAKVEIEFSEGALKLAFNATRGIPRKINVLCDRALLACYVEGTYTVDERIMHKAIQEVSGDKPISPREKKQREPVLGGLRGRFFTRKVAVAAAVGASTFILVAAAVAVGVKIANANALEGSAFRAAADSQNNRNENRNGKQITPSGRSRNTANDQKTTRPQNVARAAPTPAPDWEQIRRNNPNWKYERNSPLVRVNNPKAVLRAAQLSMLKMWGIAVDLTEMAKLGEDLVLNGELKSEALRIRQMPISGDYYEAVRLNVPLIVRIKEPAAGQSEYLLLLRAEGEAVTVGDPVWGVKTYKAKEIIKKWDGASVVFVDVNQLAGLQRGEKGDRVRALQQFLKENSYLDEVSGVYDVKTTEAIRKLQSYYRLKETGQLDDVTLLILNSRMMRNGPRLGAGETG